MVERMIGKLKGLIDSYGEDYVILDVGGVGYQVHCSARTLQALPVTGRGGGAVDRDLCARGSDQSYSASAPTSSANGFGLLQTVQGVGAKVALAVLSTLPPAELANAIALRDKAAVARTRRVSARKSPSASSLN